MTEQQTQILNYIKEHPNCGGLDVGFELGMPLEDCYLALEEMVSKGIVVRDDSVLPKTLRAA